MKKQITKKTKREARHRKIRKKVIGTNQRPRLFVFKSNQYIYAGVADDMNGKVLFSESDANKENKIEGTKQERARIVGENIASKALKSGVKKVTFDRGGYVYHGRIKEVAEGARSKGLIF